MLSYGMPYDLFWHGDTEAINYYLDMAEMKHEREMALVNQQCYLQGQYIYTALCAVAPVLHAFAKKGTKPQPYPDKPFTLGRHESSEDEEMTPELEAERVSLMTYYQMKMIEAKERAQAIIENERGLTADGE